jgi:hypothetical protein
VSDYFFPCSGSGGADVCFSTFSSDGTFNSGFSIETSVAAGLSASQLEKIYV